MDSAGFKFITNIDISDNVISKMRDHYRRITPTQEFLVIDATRMAYRDNSFDICIDKGTYDALACGSESSV
jgi:ubiquinone/menaquinone biosynthesis C-methylase UbiE